MKALTLVYWERKKGVGEWQLVSKGSFMGEGFKFPLSEPLKRDFSLFVCPICARHCFDSFKLQQPCEVRLNIPILQIKLREFNWLVESHKGGKWQNWIQISSDKPDLCDSKAYSMPLLECQPTFRFSQPLTHQRASASLNSQANLCVFPAKRTTGQASPVSIHNLLS